MPPSKTLDPVLVECERLGFDDYRLIAQFDLDQLSVSRRVQVRDVNHYSPPVECRRYAEQMKHSEFPPIVVTKDGWTIDGNTRIGGCKVNGTKFFPAYELNIKYDDATQDERRNLRALAGTLNMLNGRALTTTERRSEVRPLLEQGWKLEQIQRALGVSATIVRYVKQEMMSEEKLDRVGMLDHDDGGAVNLPAAMLHAFAHRDVQALNDEPFMALVNLAKDADLSAAEITSLAKAAKNSGSDDKALEIIVDTREEFKGRIIQKELTGSGKPPIARQLRQALGYIVTYEPGTGTLVKREAATMVETNPSSFDQHREVIKEAITVLKAVLKAQDQREQEMMAAKNEKEEQRVTTVRARRPRTTTPRKTAAKTTRTRAKAA